MNADRSPLAVVLSRNRLQQKQVAEALGVARMTVHAWVHGRSVPSGDNLIRLAEFLRRFDPSVTESALLPKQAA